MKAGWERKKIGDVCMIKPPKKEARMKIKQDDFVSFLPMEDLSSGKMIASPVKKRKFSEVIGSYTYFSEDDVLLAKITPCFENGKLGIARLLLNETGFGSSEYIVLRACKNIIPEFLYYFLSQDTFRKEGAEMMAGAVGHKRLPVEFVNEYLIPVPPLPEQRRIVAILDEAFAGIAAAKESAEKNLKNAKEVFASCLESVFSQRGEGWNEMTLKEISSSFGRGKSKHRPRNDQKLYGGKYPFIQTGDIRNANHIITDYSQTYNENGLTQSKLWPKGTICITIAANIAETAILNFDACFPDSVIGIVVNQKKSDSDYVEFLLQAFKKRIQAMSKGSAQENINLGTFETTHFPFPTVDKQREIVKYLKDIDQETNNLESLYQQKLSNLQELKKSLLQQAFSGAL
jgi:type I restriction enzyme S subunit